MNAIIESLESIVGPGGILTGEDVAGRSDTWPPTGGCRATAIVRPGTTEEVSRVLKVCHAQNQPVVTHGGVTGLVGGAVTAPNEIVLSLERMNRMEPIDQINRTVTVDAGIPLQKVQEAAEQANLLFPLDLGARGSATIGGNIATNAGGNGVIRYGMMRDQLLGLEAVLADGTIISSMNNVIKNNTGYDLKQLFAGSEGTLGIITRAVLRLRPLPRSQNTAFVAIPGFTELAQFLQTMDSALGGTLSAFEVMWNDFYTLTIGDGSRHGTPLEMSHPFYVLLESAGGDAGSDGVRFENALQEAFDQSLIVDAVIAQSKQQRSDLWGIRDDVERLFESLYPPVAFDISLSIPDMDDYVRQVRELLEREWPNGKMVAFGHLGDGNIHLVIGVGSMEPETVHAVENIVYGELARRKGIISAEHGIGLAKKAFLGHSRSAEEIVLMKTIKSAMDPQNILNPGKILDMSQQEQT
ncbi:MAG: FAD-binding oxidoreductase [Gammaproteobacteria bacterium]|nr:FAD-binding oxidoreductase [Gammaproteobacteria bacterium]